MMTPRVFRNRRLHGDEGASLLVVLVVCGLLGIVLAALTSFGSSAEMLTLQLNNQAQTTYSAGSALDAAINAASRDHAWGVDPGTGPGACPTVTLPASGTGVNATAVDVSCKFWTDSGKPSTGNGVNSSNRPKQAVLTLPVSGDGFGFEQKSGSELRVHGDVYVGNKILTNAAGAQLTVTGSLKAKGACDNTTTPPKVTASGGAICNSAIVATPVDPRNDSDSSYAGTWVMPAVTPTNPVKSVPTSCGPSNFVALDPGNYTDAAALTTLTSTGCVGGTVYFRPGNYYFNFPSGSPTWTVDNPNTTIIGGLINGWSESSPSGSYDPTVNTCKGTDLNHLANSGVAFVFGGYSQWSIQSDKSVQLCAQPQSSKQEIVVWGVTSADVPAGSGPKTATLTGTFTSAATGGATTTFVAPGNAAKTETPVALTSDAVLATTDKPDAVADLHGSFDLSSLPSSATITGARLEVTHRETGTNAANTTVSWTSGTSSGAAVTHSTLTKDTFTLKPADLSLSTPTTADFKATLAGKNNTARSATASVDAMQLVVDYSVPAVTPETGCVTASTTAGGCGLIVTNGTKARGIYLRGTTFAPSAYLDIQLTNEGSQAFSRGVVARTVTANITSSSDFTGSVFDLPDLSAGGPALPRKMTFTAKVGGNQVATAVVQFDDSTLPATATILSWNVGHCSSTTC